MGILNWESETPVQGPALPPPAVCSRQPLLFSRPGLSSAQQGVRHQDVRGSCAVSGHRGIEELRGQVRGNIEKGSPASWSPDSSAPRASELSGGPHITTPNV